MKLKGVTFMIVLGLLILATAALAQDDEHPHWTYEGEEGPAHWGELDESFAACSVGNAQSPIDITNATPVQLTDIEFNYDAVPMAIFNNGHTIQVQYAEGSHIVYNEITYDLVQFHFHQPSEHTVNGEAFGMELHLVHRDPLSGNLAVVGVLLREGDADNAAYAPLFDNLPTEVSEADMEAEMTINATDLLPASHAYYTYNGSLTTPPCTQIVRWLVLTEPVEVSAAQLEAFGAIYSMNARPVQPLNNRDLLENTSEG